MHNLSDLILIKSTRLIIYKKQIKNVIKMQEFYKVPD